MVPNAQSFYLTSADGAVLDPELLDFTIEVPQYDRFVSVYETGCGEVFLNASIFLTPSQAEDTACCLLECVDKLNGATRKVDRRYAGELLEAVEEALEFVEDQEDVVDGSYGEPRPNKAMSIAQTLRKAIRLATGSKQ